MSKFTHTLNNTFTNNIINTLSSPTLLVNRSNETGNDFFDLAKKLREERFDKNEILFYKQNAVYAEKLKIKKKKLAIVIQKVFRGFLVRKVISAKIENINTEAIIGYFKNKRKERIKASSFNIINNAVKTYITKQREAKRRIYWNYLNYCSSQIGSLFKGYMYRRTFLPYFYKYQVSCGRVFDLIISCKVRRIVNTRRLASIILDIARFKKCLSVLNKQDEITEEFIISLGLISDELKTEDEAEFNYQIENISNKLSLMRQDYTSQKEIRERKFYDVYYKYYLTGQWVREKPYNAERSALDEYMSILNNDSLFIEEYTKYSYIDLKRPKKTKVNVNNDTEKEDKNNELEEAEEKGKDNLNDADAEIEKENNEDQEADEMADNHDNNDEENPDNEFINPDDRVIRYHEGYDLNKINQFDEQADKQKTRVIKKHEPLKRKQPKYDARKAIEDAKKKEERESSPSKGKERNDFRSMLKQIKSNEKEAKPKIQEEIDKELEEEIRLKLKNMDYGSTERPESNVNKPMQIMSSRTNRRINDKRLKLHQLERSPKNKFNIKNVKSRVDCWGESGFNKRIVTSPSNEKPKLNPQLLSRIEQEVININNKLNSSTYREIKEERFKNLPIAYIKDSSFYVKHYNPEIYDQLLIHLNQHYDELKS